jgi:hypothetical protein
VLLETSRRPLAHLRQAADLDVQMHTVDRQAYRDALHRAIRAMEEARRALVDVVQRPEPPRKPFA